MASLFKILIIADDLTGANDTGVQFAKREFNTLSLLDVRRSEYVQEAEVLVCNLETRSLDPQAAYQKIKAFSQMLDFSSIPFVYKKIDSTMRGNIGVEIDALLDCSPFDIAAVVPAYPKNGRTTVGGYHLVNQLLLEDSEAAHDPKSPVTESYLPALLARQSKRTVGHIDIKIIRENRIVQEMRNCISQNEQIVVFDSFSQNDLQSVTEAILESGLRVLWVGSAGLAECLSGRINGGANGKPTEQESRVQGNFPIFTIAGSVSVITRKQIQTLCERDDFRTVSVDPLAILTGEDRTGQLNKLCKAIVATIDEGKNPILTTEASETVMQSVRRWKESHGTGDLETGNQIADFLGELGRMVVSQRELRGLILTGGDIAYRTCEYLQVPALRIVDEVEEGIPLCEILGGEAAHMSVVTKAGAFGDEQSLLRAAEKIKNFK